MTLLDGFTPLDYLLILEALVLVSAGVVTWIGVLGARDNPNDKLRRVMRKFWRELLHPTLADTAMGMPIELEELPEESMSKSAGKGKTKEDSTNESCTIGIKVVPGSSQNQIAGKLGDAIKIQVSAAPEGGEANKAVIDLLAEALGISAYRIKLVRGHYDSRKIMRISGMTSEQVDDVLSKFF